jgi:hypothetical protein
MEPRMRTLAPGCIAGGKLYNMGLFQSVGAGDIFVHIAKSLFKGL